MEEAPGHHQPLGRGLDMEDPGASGHPLGVAVGDQATAPVGVLMLEGAVDHVGHGLEPTMGMPRGALGLAGRVVDLAHLVHVHEGIQLRLSDSGKRPTDREALSFKRARGDRDRGHRPIEGQRRFQLGNAR
jgi:hypothetical protein